MRVRVELEETFAFELFELDVPLFVVTVDERLVEALLFSLVVDERVEVAFVPDEFDRVVEVDRVSAPSLNEVLRLTSPLLLLRTDELLLSTDETLRCDEVGRVPEDLKPLA